VIWWTVAMFVAGLAYGSAVGVLEDYADNQTIEPDRLPQRVGAMTTV
jgi:putative exporter of polyketide antibiotics